VAIKISLLSPTIGEKTKPNGLILSWHCHLSMLLFDLLVYISLKNITDADIVIVILMLLFVNN